jgi:hypothetical protein
LNILAVFTGGLSAAEVLELIPGLMSERFSRFRAKWLFEHPGEKPADDGLSFFGWSQDSALLAQIHNALFAVHVGKKAPKYAIQGPKANSAPKLFAPSIRDFNVGRFMSVINGT